MSSYDASSVWAKLKNTIKRWMDGMKKNKSQPMSNTMSNHTTSSTPARTAPPATMLAMQRSQNATNNQDTSSTNAVASTTQTNDANGKLPQRASATLAPGGSEISPTSGAEVRGNSIDAAQSIDVSTLDKEEDTNENVEQTAQMKEMGMTSRATTTSPTPSDGTILSGRGSGEVNNQVKLVDIRPAQRAPVDKVDPLTAPEVVNHFDDEKMVVVSEPTPTGLKRPGLPTGMSATSGPLEDFPMGPEHY